MLFPGLFSVGGLSPGELSPGGYPLESYVSCVIFSHPRSDGWPHDESLFSVRSVLLSAILYRFMFVHSMYAFNRFPALRRE